MDHEGIRSVLEAQQAAIETCMARQLASELLVNRILCTLVLKSGDPMLELDRIERELLGDVSDLILGADCSLSLSARAKVRAQVIETCRVVRSGLRGAG